MVSILKNFQLLATDLDVEPVIELIEDFPELWDEITVRQAYPGSCHADTQTIFLRGPRSLDPKDFFFDLTARPYPAMRLLERRIAHIFLPLLPAIGIKELGRMMIVKLKPHGVIFPHVDEGVYAEHFTRFHVCLQAGIGSSMTAEDETVCMQEGQAWWFNHRVLHHARNDSNIPRIHLIFDAVLGDFMAVKPEPESHSKMGIPNEGRKNEEIKSQMWNPQIVTQQQLIAQVMGMGKALLK